MASWSRRIFAGTRSARPIALSGADRFSIKTGSPPEACRQFAGDPSNTPDGRDREERFGRANVRHRLLSANVLFARLEGHAECAMAFRVSRQADHTSGHFPDVLLPTCEDSEERPPEVHLRTERLPLSDDDVRAEVPRRTHDSLSNRVHADDEDPLRQGPNFLELLFESAEEVRVLDIDAADVR